MLGKKKVKPTSLSQVILEQQWAYVINLAKSYPDDVRKQFPVRVEKKETRMHALHLACTKNPNREIIDTLIECFPKAVEMTDTRFNRLPLHFACLNAANENVVRTLLRANATNSANRVATNGRLPIHYASAYGSSPEVITALIEYYPHGVRVADKRGMLPLHLACLQNASAHVILVLLKAFPESVYYKTIKGNTAQVCLQVNPEDCQNKRIVEDLLEVSKTKTCRFHAAVNSSVRGGINQFTRYNKMVTAVETAEFC